MKLPRDLSGTELIQILCKHFGYRRVNQEGSHVIRQSESPQHPACPFLTTIRCGAVR